METLTQDTLENFDKMCLCVFLVMIWEGHLYHLEAIRDLYENAPFTVQKSIR